MKKGQTKTVTSFIQKPFIKVLTLLIVLSSILFVYEIKNRKDILSNGVGNIAIISSYKFVNFLDNEKSKQTISFYRIEFDYHFNRNNYSRTLELNLEEFKNKIGHKLNTGDTIKIKHSIKNPENVIIE
jgi:hypothetical protein